MNRGKTCTGKYQYKIQACTPKEAIHRILLLLPRGLGIIAAPAYADFVRYTIHTSSISMKHLLTKTFWAFLALAVFHVPATAQSELDGPVVSTEWLAKNIDHPRLVMLHVGKDGSFSERHIRGAREIGYNDFAGRAGELYTELRSATEYKEMFENMGISDNSIIVLMFSDQWVSPTTRLYWTFDYLGHADHVYWLDGGFDKWVAEDRPVTSEAPGDVARGTFTIKENPSILASRDDVIAAISNEDTQIIDARSAGYYDGTADSHDRPKGHIKSAGNFPYSEAVDLGNLIKTRKDLAAKFAEAGYTADKSIIAYCHIGQQATVVYFAGKMLGYDVKLYDGSFQDWSMGKHLPVVNPQTAN